MALLKINGRTRFFNRVTEVKPLGNGRFCVGTKHMGCFKVEGGRKAGGNHRDWFLENDRYFTKPLNCTSLMDALHCIEML